MNCFIIEVTEDEDFHCHDYFARVNRDGNLMRPTVHRGPTVFASRREADEAIEKAHRFREAKNKFRWEKTGIRQDPIYARPVPIRVPIRTVTAKLLLEIPVQGL